MNLKSICLAFVLLTGTYMLRAQSVVEWKIDSVSSLLNQKSDKVLVLNFWATFCKPCLAEMPFFVQAAQEYKNDIDVVFVSLDMKEAFPALINKTLQRLNVGSKVVWLNESNADYFCPKIDKQWSGAIPATLILNRNTGYRLFIEEELSKKELDESIQKVLRSQN